MFKDRIQFEEYKKFIKTIVNLMNKIDVIDKNEEHVKCEFKPYDYHEIKCLKEFVDADIEKHIGTIDNTQKYSRRYGFLFLGYRSIYLPELLHWGMADTLTKFN